MKLCLSLSPGSQDNYIRTPPHPTMMPFIVIADDHSMIRMGMKLLLVNRINCTNITETDSCSGVMAELKKQQCTHLILDLIFADGTSLEIIPVIRKLYPGIKIMIFSMQPMAIYAEVLKQYDVFFFLPKSATQDETINYLKRFLSEEPYPLQPLAPIKKGNPFAALASRELEILHYLLNGHKTTEIARMLNLTKSTISTFKKRILEKTGANSLVDLYEIASLNNLEFFINPTSSKGLPDESED
jgi:two-component system, NarL family, invasion response regulator UvrY